MIPRRTLSPRGRIIAAGLSIGAAGVLAGAMAISDSTADASSSTPTNNTGFSNSDDGGTTPQFQPHTRSGGS